MSRVARKTGTGTQRQQIKRSRYEFVTRRQSVVALTCPQTYFLLDETAIVLATQRQGERSQRTEVAVFWDIYQKLLSYSSSTRPHFLQKVVASGFQGAFMFLPAAHQRDHKSCFLLTGCGRISKITKPTRRGRPPGPTDGRANPLMNLFWSGCNGCSGHLTTTAGCSVV